MSSKYPPWLTLPVALAILAVGYAAGLALAIILSVGGLWACNTLFGTAVPINASTVAAVFLLLWFVRLLIRK